MTPTTLRTLAATLRGPPRPGEHLDPAEVVEAAAAALEAAAELWRAADGVVSSYDAGNGPRWPAIETLDEALRKLEVQR